MAPDGTDDRADWLAMFMAPGHGLTRFYRLLGHFGTPSSVLQASPRDLREVPGLSDKDITAFLTYRESRIWDAELAKIDSAGVNLITLHDPDYPETLRHIYQPPPLLFCRGNLVTEDAQSIAIVGTRKATPYGLMVTERLTSELVHAGFTIVSGLARGIDQSAHRASLQSKGRTIAVLGTGLNHCYPTGTEKLHDAVAKRGCLISELPMDTRPFRGNFPRRNRIISGLSRGVLVVEAPAKSGALITAHYASEQGREVFAIPGRLTSPVSVGCHRLIQEGAKLVCSVGDILEEFGIESPQKDASDTGPRFREPQDPHAKAVLRLLSDEPVHIDVLLRQSSLPFRELGTILLQLELSTIIRQLPGKYYILDPRLHDLK